MIRRNTYTPGDWKAICDVCGFRFMASELKERWDGLMTCRDDWEARHISDFLRVRQERITPPWTRPEASLTFVNVSYGGDTAQYWNNGYAEPLYVI